MLLPQTPEPASKFYKQLWFSIMTTIIQPIFAIIIKMMDFMKVDVHIDV